MLFEGNRPGSSPYKNEPHFQMAAFRGIWSCLFCQPGKIGVIRHCEATASGASHGAHSSLWKFLPLWCSILCCASLALRCHRSAPLLQHSPQIHREGESRLFLPWFRKHRLLYRLHNLSGVAQRILAGGSAPQPGYLSCTWRLWELISHSLQGNPSSQDQKISA